MPFAEYPHALEMATRDSGSMVENGGLPAFSPDLLREGRLMLALGIAKPTIARMMLRARENGSTVEDELLVSGEIEESAFFEAIATALGLPFLKDVDAARVHDAAALDTQLVSPHLLRLYDAEHPPITVVVPSLARFEAIASALARNPRLARILAVSTPCVIRSAAWTAGRHRRVRSTVNGLFEAAPFYSARIVFWGRQGFYAGIGVMAILVAAILSPAPFLVAAHVLLTSLYFGQLLLRFRALTHESGAAGPLPVAPPPSGLSGHLPVYSILVALYREEAVVAQLVGALDRLDWPRSRLDIKLVCEEDDRDTIDALRALSLGPHFEIVTVPACEPRTKPKALTYALPGVRGTYCTIYDAEDRPAPGQLREAHAAFLSSRPEIACLQSPLVVTNAREGWLSALFALEYSALFRRLLPYLSAADLPLPLGGTSNHFRTAVLREVGGWDPFNTTEDADLGLRLYRLGYRSRMIAQPTFEDAPVRPGDWFGQRTRWYKGWLQTWLVLMRDPVLLLRQMGPRAFIVFQILIAGMILSALTHLLSIGYLGYLAWSLAVDELSPTRTLVAAGLLVIDCINVLGSYAMMIGLGRRPMSREEQAAVGRKWIAMPLYWLMTSAAAWAAVIELYRTPFAWTKTPHRPVVRRDDGTPAQRRRSTARSL